METGIKASFIPQAPVTSAPRQKQRGGHDFLFLVALVIFVASVTLAVGVFLYDQFLNRSAASKQSSLERAKSEFDPALIAQLSRLDDRMRAGDEILGAHSAPTSLFHLLEQLTLQTVSFSNLDFSAEESGNARISMQGLAKSVNSIALQADLLSKSGFVTNPIFSNINREIGGVRFNFTAHINEDALRFVSLIDALNAAQTPQQEVPAQQTTPASPFNSSSGSTSPSL